MDSFIGIDPTLPIDLDGSSNPDFLPDITGNHFEYADGSVPMVAKSNGRMSPIRARTMKEYDQHIAELKKENFSLKLRIYFLEERMQQKFGNEEDVFKTNIELKVEVESQKRELLDKHELIQKASTAMESLTSKHNQDLKNLANQYESELKRLREESERQNQQDYGQMVEELKAAHDSIGKLETQLETEVQRGKDLLQQIQELKPELEEKKSMIVRLTEDHNKLEDEFISVKGELEETRSKSDEMSDMVARLQMELGRKERDIHHLSSAFRDTSIVDSESILAPTHLQDVVDDQKETISKLSKEPLNLQSPDVLRSVKHNIGSVALRDH
ncbi:CDK5 regulatory subunit-associated protein 2-like [Gigantopelta aegis]|uniref:CDK5 regulatory subunit-associated protein 2-like n=1 Tax=Gigantopelta aegis TaxID=1735272 RepID=UPI001B887E1C|nr:CDK5 regulatory subunit-associated protein 2-like [Gigantopelta aegis]